MSYTQIVTISESEICIIWYKYITLECSNTSYSSITNYVKFRGWNGAADSNISFRSNTNFFCWYNRTIWICIESKICWFTAITKCSTFRKEGTKESCLNHLIRNRSTKLNSTNLCSCSRHCTINSGSTRIGSYNRYLCTHCSVTSNIGIIPEDCYLRVATLLNKFCNIIRIIRIIIKCSV